ncbi:MAG: bacillithiol biosynthesis deacetylase BshB1 [Bacteroidota bacterium]|jgi:bacillithiol biosynthesis deacetylase BshB1|nr:bacillithiol biosynthesis deacetylase BshB1 [Bacteroidota bacterium]
MKLDILVLAAHPDDAELSCAGTLITHIQKGFKVGIVDLTQGEMGTRGTIQTRAQEAMQAAKIMGLAVRENLELEDVFFNNSLQEQLKVIQAIRKFKPDIVLANAISDRHPDHGKGAKLAIDAFFMSGLKKIVTYENEMEQEAWRPKVLYHFIQNNYIKPDFIVDVSDVWDQKLDAIKVFKSQFYNADSKEDTTFISTPDFLPFIEARSREMGHAIGKRYGEGFTVNRFIGVGNLFDLI